MSKGQQIQAELKAIREALQTAKLHYTTAHVTYLGEEYAAQRQAQQDAKEFWYGDGIEKAIAKCEALEKHFEPQPRGPEFYDAVVQMANGQAQRVAYADLEGIIEAHKRAGYEAFAYPTEGSEVLAERQVFIVGRREKR